MPFAAIWMDLEIIILSEVIRERQISYDITYMWNLKQWYQWIYLQSRHRLTDFENKHCYQRQKVWGVEDKLGIWDWHIHTTIYKTDNQQESTV